MRKIKQSLASIMAILIIIAIVPTMASAAGSSISNATAIKMDTKYSGSITETNTEDVYKFTISASGAVHIDLTAYIYETYYYIYDTKGNTVWSKQWQYWNDVSKEYNMDENVDLASGTYYFAIQKSSGTGNYNFKLSFKSANASFNEPNGGDNNSIATADSISLDTKYYGQIACNDDCDIYKFTFSKSGRIHIDLTAYIYETDYYIYDVKGNNLWSKQWQYWNDVSKEYNMDENVDLTSGTYYFAVKKNSGTGNYNFKFSYTSAGETFGEPNGGDNNSIATADSISLGTKYYGQIASNDDCDIYKFTLSSSGTITLNIKAYIYETDYYIYDIKGKEVWLSTYNYWNDTSKELNFNKEIDLSSGTYYFAVKRNSGTGNYNFIIRSGAYAAINGLAKDPDTGRWMYYEDGNVNYDYVGLVKNPYGWWYVQNGTINYSFKGLAKNQYGWWYVQNGTINFSYVGLAKNQYGWWYVKNGTINYRFKGLAKNQYGWWYVQNGTIDFSYVGLAKNQYGWWYIQNGTINYSFRGLVKNQYGWWYVQNGTINFNYNGYASNQYGTWRVVNGKVVGK